MSTAHVTATATPATATPAIETATAMPLAAATPEAGRWHRAYLAVALPALLVGFAASVLADRLLFVAWGFASALAYGFFLRATWPRPPFAWRCALLVSFAGAFAWLVVAFHEPLKLGMAAYLPARGAP